MVKEIKKDKKTEQEPDVVDASVEGESETIKEKKAHAKKFAKSVKKFNSKVKSALEKKQVIKAVEALKAYSQKQRQDKTKMSLLADSEDYIIATFTLT